MPLVMLLLLSALYATIAATKFVATNHDVVQVRAASPACWVEERLHACASTL